MCPDLYQNYASPGGSTWEFEEASLLKPIPAREADTLGAGIVSVML